MVEIRTYTEGDFENVVTLWVKCFSYPAPHNNPEKAIHRKVAINDGLFFIAVSREEVTGTIMAGWDGHRGWIYSLAVDPGHRMQGTGKKLVNHAIEELRKRDCPKVNLQVMPENTEVVGFYKKLGFAAEERLSMGQKLY